MIVHATVTLKKRDNNRARDVKKNRYCAGNNLLRHRSGAVFAACSLEWRINHVIIVLSFHAATVRETRDSDLDREAEATIFEPIFISVELYIIMTCERISLFQYSV